MNRTEIGKSKPGRQREKAWLEHLRIMAELPYPSWALMPSLIGAVRTRLSAGSANFGWSDGISLRPLAVWTDRINEQALRWFMGNFDEFFDELSIRAMRDSGGELMRHFALSEDFKRSLLYTGILEAYGLRWGMCAPVALRSGQLGFLTLYREEEHGPYSDGEQALLHAVAGIVGGLDGAMDRQLPDCEHRETACATLLLGQDGHMFARSERALELLFLARETAVGQMEWARSDWHALPTEVRAAAKQLLSNPGASAQHRVRESTEWSGFDFVLEKMPNTAAGTDALLTVSIRHHEPLDIALARRLLDWPLSPREKRILLASCRPLELTELAEFLGIALSTLKSYINEMQRRFGVDSRRKLIERIMLQPDRGCNETRP